MIVPHSTPQAARKQFWNQPSLKTAGFISRSGDSWRVGWPASIGCAVHPENDPRMCDGFLKAGPLVHGFTGITVADPVR
jgi:hypothetical protein